MANDATSADRAPLVSVILPTYNRARFLPQAFASIEAQDLADWELIVVDDGSTDETADVVRVLSGRLAQPVRCVRQPNRGAYAARNRGLELARGRYVAFFDSDDVWLPHHLADCVAALQQHQDLDWVYGACRVVNFETGRELEPHTFYVRGRPRPFLSLRARLAGPLRLIDDPRAVRCQILHGLFCGLQNSVIRRRVFHQRPFQAEPRNEVEDQLYVVRALKAGCRFGYFNAVHVIYHVHGTNSSLAVVAGSVTKRVRLLTELVHAYEALPAQVALTWREKLAARKRLGDEYFWHLGYSLLWEQGRRREACASFRRALRLRPWDVRYWKSYVLAVARWRLESLRCLVRPPSLYQPATTRGRRP